MNNIILPVTEQKEGLGTFAFRFAFVDLDENKTCRIPCKKRHVRRLQVRKLKNWS